MITDYPHLLGQQADCQELYIDLMKRCLLNWPYLDKEKKVYPVRPRRGVKRLLSKLLGLLGIGLHYVGPETKPADRLRGGDWPFAAHTMVGIHRLDNLQACMEDVLKNEVPGDFIETGVWRGGCCIFMRALLKAFQETDRKVWVADSFQGLPPPDYQKHPREGSNKFFQYKQLAVGLEEVRDNFRRYGLLDDQVCFLRGWFEQTLPTAPIEQLAILRLDGDMYGSTITALTHLYPKVSVGGYVIIDDYSIPECNRAVQDYRQAHRITDPLNLTFDEMGAYWRRLDGSSFKLDLAANATSHEVRVSQGTPKSCGDIR
jgi:O-methyltransferase